MNRYQRQETLFYCAVNLTMSIIGGKWKALVLWNLRDGKKRFNELKKRLVVINDKVLSNVLKELEADGVVSRLSYPVIPPRVEYALTEEGTKLLPIMQLMEQYGERFKID